MLLIGLGYASTLVTLFSYLEGKFTQGDTDILLEQFDKISNELSEIKFELHKIQNLIVEQKVSLFNI